MKFKVGDRVKIIDSIASDDPFINYNAVIAEIDVEKYGEDNPIGLMIDGVDTSDGKYFNRHTRLRYYNFNEIVYNKEHNIQKILNKIDQCG